MSIQPSNARGSLRDRLTSSRRLVVKEVAAFGLVGGVSFMVDIGGFNLLLHHGVGVLTAKAISTAVSTTLAYFGNRHLSFSHRARSGLGREAGFFFGINLITLVISELLLALFAYPLHYKYDHWVMNAVNLGTVAIGTVFRFWAYKRFVFLHPDRVSTLSSSDDTQQLAA